MDFAQNIKRWLLEAFRRRVPSIEADPEGAQKIIKERVGAVQDELDRVGALQDQLNKDHLPRPTKVAPRERHETYIDVDHRVVVGRREIGEAKKLLKDGKSLEWIFDEYLPTTKMLRRVVSGSDNSKNRTEQQESLRNILIPQVNEEGDLRGRPKDTAHLLDYLADQHGVEPATIEKWITLGRKDAKEYAKDPDRMSLTFDLHRPTLLDLSEEERESLALGHSVTLSNGKLIGITTLGTHPLNVSDLSDQDEMTISRYFD